MLPPLQQQSVVVESPSEPVPSRSRVPLRLESEEVPSPQ